MERIALKKIHNGKANVTNDFSALTAAVQKKNNKIDFCILTFLLGHTQIQMGKVVEDDFVKDLNLNRKKSPKMI